MVARQRLRVGASHAGKIVTIIAEDIHFRILDGQTELYRESVEVALPTVAGAEQRRDVANLASVSGASVTACANAFSRPDACSRAST